MGGVDITICNALKSEYRILQALERKIKDLAAMINLMNNIVKDYFQVDKVRADVLNEELKSLLRQLGSFNETIVNFTKDVIYELIKEKCIEVNI